MKCILWAVFPALLLAAAGCATTVERDELALEVTLGALDPTPGQWYYMGTADGYHYFRKENFVSGGNGIYRIRAEAVKLEHPSAFSRDRRKWRRAERELEPLKKAFEPSGRRQAPRLERVADVFLPEKATP